MNYFKNENNQIFAYDDEQVSQGYGNYLTPITIEEVNAINQAKEDGLKATPEYKLQEANRYLINTGWIWEKFSRNVVVLKDMTEEEFRLKYADIIAEQERNRLLINELELQLGGN